MRAAQDFRQLPSFLVPAVNRSGRYIGNTFYWKLFSIENYYRVIVHSILSVQLKSDWWGIAVDPRTQRKVKDFRSNYASKPWHTTPGGHLIYYTTIFQLNEIVRTNAHLFEVVIIDIDEWIAKIESIQYPRNIIAHMNFPTKDDRVKINLLYNEFIRLVEYLIIDTRLKLLTP